MDAHEAPFVLIVEDDLLIAQIIAQMLHTVGYQTHIALDAEAAIDDVPVLRPDLITLDLCLPGMSGATFLHYLRATPQTGDLPVILITSQESIRPELRALADDVLIKPFAIEDLIGIVGATIAKTRTCLARDGQDISCPSVARGFS